MMKPFAYLSQRAVAVLLLAACLCGPANAEGVYKWVDDEGNVHFGDLPPAEWEAEEVELQINSYTSVSVEQGDYHAGNRVTMYSTDWCGYCRKAKAYFEANNIPYEELDIERDATAKREFDRLGGGGVPLILVGDRRMRGFSEARFEQLYADAGY